MKISRLLLIIWGLIVFAANMVIADDNAATGDNQSGTAVAGFYRSRDCMYKVSVYIGTGADSNVRGSISDFYLLGKPVFLARSDFRPATGYKMYATSINKIDHINNGYMDKKSLGRLDESRIIYQPHVPAIPIINGGNISAVKTFFGDTNTLNGLIQAIANQAGISVEQLLLTKEYTIAGLSGKPTLEELLPQKKSDGTYKNKVPYLIVYEPVAVGYLTDKQTALAFTATEYALASKGKIFNFFNTALGGANAQLMWGLSHRDLPNSIFLEEPWFHFPARAKIRDRKRTSAWTVQDIEKVNNAIISGSGWGMRYLKANMPIPLGGKEDEPIANVVTYRTNTDVITSVMASVPNADDEGKDIFNPSKTATVTFKIGEEEKTHELIIPTGGSQYAWVKWRTPSTPGEVLIHVTASEGIKFPGNTTSVTILARIEEIIENTPPDTKPTDTAVSMGFLNKSAPTDSTGVEKTWGEYSATWHEHLVDRGDWERDKNGVIVVPNNWLEDWVDEGWWDWEFTTYKATLKTEVTILPSVENETAKKVGYNDWEMKSGYGFQMQVKPVFTTDAPSDHYATTGSAFVFFPEFNYENYYRHLEKKSGSFTFKENKYSHWKSRVHFSPLWFPDGEYKAYTEVIDYWTPAGMLQFNKSGKMTIKGDMYDDWQALPALQ